MSDLISRSAVIDIIHKEIERTTSFAEHDTQIKIEFAVEELPTAYDVDKVVEQLERWKTEADILLLSEKEIITRNVIDSEIAIDLVKAGGKSEAT